MGFTGLAILALGSLPFFASAIPVAAAQTGYPSVTEFAPTQWLPCADCSPVTITGPSQMVTSVEQNIETTSFYAQSPGVYTPPHQTSVWTVYEPTWVTYEVPCETAYIMSYSDAICVDCIKDVQVIVFVVVDIILYEHQNWVPSGTTTVVSTVVETATPNIGYTPTYSSYSPVKTHTVKVGGLAGNVTGGTPILRYDPEYIDGGIGDVVEFLFLANNHTATQADFNSPCFPKAGGFNTGFRPNKANILGQVSNTFTISDTSPVWFYCAQTAGPKPHCQFGMVFAINAQKVGNKTLEDFQNAAMNVPFVAPSSTASSSSTIVTSSYTAAYTASSYVATTTTYASPRTTHYVTVGGLVAGNPKPVLRYNPQTVNAIMGDVVQFNFLAANHTVTQSSFDSPCVAIPDGFKTGVQMNPNNINGLILKEFIVDDDTKPLWFYCGFSNHCEKGMVFAINPLDKFPAFQAKAIGSSTSSVASSTIASYSPSTTAAATTYAPPSTTHFVTVGGLVAGNPKPVLRYNPQTVNAKLGDTISFNFLAANHTVTQSSFDSPCVAIPDGFKTGVQMNPNNIDGLIIKEFIVDDTKPIWFYCGFSNHCEQGMVFAVNPLDKFPAFQAKAIGSTPYTSV